MQTPQARSVNSLSNLSQRLDMFLHTHYPSNQPGLALRFQVAGETVYERYVGSADVATNTLITGSTNFRMASVTKQFTAMAVALLERAGLLSYQDPLSRFFPELGTPGGQIMLHHLLTHTSGLSDYEEHVPVHQTRQVHDLEVLHISAAHNTFYFRPGTAFRYSNTGYVLLGLVVERVAQMPFGDFLRSEIFMPLGMATTTLYSPAACIENRAMGYAPGQAGAFVFSDQSPCSATQGDGCLYTSMQDYLTWHHALHHHPNFLLEPLLQQVHAPISGYHNAFYGMGWFFSNRSRGGYELCHSGNTCGFSHLVVSVPEQDVLLIAFSNRADNPHLLDPLLKTVTSTQPEAFPLESDLPWFLPVLTR